MGDLGFQAIFALVEALQVGQPRHLAVGDLVEAVLHPGREAGVHQIREMLLQQGRDGKGREAGHQGIVLEGGVAAIDDCADDRGVGGGPADALLLEHLHQGRLAVAGRRLGLVAQGFHLLAGGAIPHLEAGQQHLLAFEGRIGVIGTLHIGAKETGEINALAGGTEAGQSQGAAIHLELHRQHGEPGFGHLAGHGALPDQLIEGQIAAIEAGGGRISEAVAGGAYRFVGLLGIAGLGGELARRRAQVFLAVFGGHAAAGGIDGLVAEVHRIGAHVGDEATLVEPLGGSHRFPGRESQFAVCLLLQGAGGEGGNRFAHAGLGLHLGHPPGGLLHRLLELAGLSLCQQPHLAAGLEGAGGLIEIAATGDLDAAQLAELGLKAAAGLLQPGLEVPVAAAAEGPAGPLALHEQAHRHRLNPAGAQPPRHLFPQQGREGVAHQPIQDPPGFLGVHQLHVELAGLIQSPADRLLGDLVEDHPLHRHLGAEQLQQVPADRFALPVFVRGQQQPVGTLEGVLELLDHLFFVLRHHVEGLEIAGGVHAQVCPLLALMGRRNLAGVIGQVADMAHGGLHLEVLRKEAANGAGLRWALDNHQGVTHRPAHNRIPLYRIHRPGPPPSTATVLFVTAPSSPPTP